MATSVTFTYDGNVFSGGNESRMISSASISVAKTSGTQIKLTVNNNSSTHLQFPGGQINMKLEIGLSTSSNGTYTYKTVYTGDPYQAQVNFTTFPSWTYTVSAAATTQNIYVKFRVTDTGNGDTSTVSSSPTYGSYNFAAGTTNCGAPTSVSASGTIGPNGTFIVSWSGATSGTNNTITGYTVYYRISQNGDAPTTSTTTYKNVSSTATSGSTTITVSNATRGYKVVCGIVTKGSAGSSYYSSIKTGGLVTINATAPAFKSITEDETNTYAAINSAGTGYSSSNYYTRRKVFTLTPNKSGTVYYYWDYSTDGSNWTMIKSGSATASTASPKTWTCNFDSLITSLGLYTGQMLYWRMRFKFNDGAEDSAIVTKPATNAYYCAAAAPASLYNNFSSSNAAPSSYMGRKIRGSFYNDTSCTSWNVRVLDASNNNTSLPLSLVASTSGNYRILDATLTTDPPAGHRLRIQMEAISTGGIIKTACDTIAYTALSVPILTYANPSLNTYNVFDDTGTVLPIPHSYTGQTAGVSYIDRWINIYNNQRSIKNFTTGAGTSAQMSLTDIYNFATDTPLGITNYSGAYSVQGGIILTNETFGQEIIKTYPITFAFDTAVANFSVSPSYSLNGSTYSALSTKAIQEGLPLRFSGTIPYYSKRNLKVALTRNDVLVTSQTITINNQATNRTTAASTNFIFDYVTPTITTNQTHWAITVTPVSGNTEVAAANSSSFNTNSVILTSPISAYTNCSYANNAYTYIASTNNTTNWTSKNYYIKNETEALSVTTTTESTEPITVAQLTSDLWTTQNAYLAVDATFQGETGWITEKTFVSPNFFALSRIGPTVSYRPNFVGINCVTGMTTPPTDEVLQIRTVANRDTIRFYGENSSQTLDITPTSISLPSDGKIYINSNDLLLDTLYPIGSTVCMNDLNANPSNRLGGTWALTDKQFINLHSSDVSSYFTAVSSAIKNPAIRLYRAGHSISIRLQFTTVAAMSTTSSGVKLGDFDLTALGINSGSLPTPRPLFWGGGTAQSLLAIVNTNGELVGYNVMPSGTLPANTTLLGFWTLVAPAYMATDSVSYMLDSACDKFYFTRTS